MLSQSRVNGWNKSFVSDFPKKNVSRKQTRKWKCILPETLIGNYIIVPLTSAKMIKSEGYMMNNCCREYIAECAEKNYAIFSIRRRSGERLATLGLCYDKDYWRFDQCVGPLNKDVMEETRGYLDEDGMLHTEIFATELYFVAHEVGRLMNSSISTQ